jgi:hypothetical protein
MLSNLSFLGCNISLKEKKIQDNYDLIIINSNQKQRKGVNGFVFTDGNAHLPNLRCLPIMFAIFSPSQWKFGCLF